MPDIDAYDVFLLHNERENRIEEIAEGLRARGVALHFWRTDIAPGQQWMAVERDRLIGAASVAVILGPQGWGPTQELLLNEARAAGSRLVPVLIGDPAAISAADLDKGDRLFRDARYQQLRSATWEEDLGGLAAALPRATLQHPAVASLIQGDDDARAQIIDKIATGRMADPLRLKSDLLALLEGRLAPDRESSRHAYETDLPSVQRGWVLVALVFLGSDDGRVREILARHYDAAYEPEYSVRFWLLDAVAGKSAGWGRQAALQMSQDPSGDVRYLARILLTDDRNSLAPQLRRDLSSKSSGALLQALRAAPIPDLIPDLVRLFDRDRQLLGVCNALTHRVPPSVALEALRVSYDDTAIARSLVTAGGRGNRAAQRRFARLLAEMGAAEAQAALTLVELDPSLEETVRNFRRLMTQSDADLSTRRIAGYQSDTILNTPDYLEIRSDVEALTAVMLAKDLNPPLAIGLFGAWGSGKSFFMQSMRGVTAQLREDYPDEGSPFCRQVVEIEFNAWHYADGSLWASLVSHIIDCLNRHVAPAPTQADQNADLMGQLESAKARSRDLETQREAALQQIKTKETDLEALRLRRENAAVRLDQLRLADLTSVLRAETALKAELSTALKDLGAPTAVTDLATLEDAVRETHAVGGRLFAFTRAFATWRGFAMLVGIAAVVFGLPALTGWAFNLFDDGLAELSRRIVSFLSVLGSGALAFRYGLGVVSTHLSKLEAVKAKLDVKLADRRQNPSDEERELQAEVAQLRGREEQVATQVRSAEAIVLDLEQQLAALREKGSLRAFLTERSSSDDYRKHLGVMATVRRDFEALTERLAKPPSEGGRSVERIVLYIDDLDRCPAEKVVQVLEAVHLLLAFPLFVVVVGVDPRWLTDALNTHHSSTLSQDAELGRHATARDFLEKIFQIPIALRPMTDRGFANLMGGLMGEAVPREPESVSPTTDGPTEAALETSALDDAPLSQGLEDVQAGDPTRSSTEANENVPEASMILDVSLLVITDAERRFAEGLHPFFTTPRAAKRFVNTYRLLKAQVDPADRGAFEDELGEGAFRTAMVMLALEISPSPSARTLMVLLGDVAQRRIRTAAQFHQALTKLEADAALTSRVKDLVPQDGGQVRLEDIRTWWPLVVRYSFAPRAGA